MMVYTYNTKLLQYGKALQNYRGGLINYQEMMALCVYAEKDYLNWLEANRIGSVEFD